MPEAVAWGEATSPTSKLPTRSRLVLSCDDTIEITEPRASDGAHRLVGRVMQRVQVVDDHLRGRRLDPVPVDQVGDPRPQLVAPARLTVHVAAVLERAEDLVDGSLVDAEGRPDRSGGAEPVGAGDLLEHTDPSVEGEQRPAWMRIGYLASIFLRSMDARPGGVYVRPRPCWSEAIRVDSRVNGGSNLRRR